MRINWYGSFSQGQGYSGSSEKMAIALERLGADIRVLTFPDVDKKQRVTPEGQKLINKTFALGDIGLCYGFPNAFDSVQNKFKVGFTMFETDTLPNGKNRWAGKTGVASDAINRMDLLLVPSQHNVELFRKHGVTIPIEKVNLGFDPDHYVKMWRPKRRVFTFMMLGTLTIRKNVAMAVSAFMSLFGDRDDVQLLLKTSGGTLAHLSGLAPNIKIIDKYSSVEEMFCFYKDADCFLFPSRGEGFGLPPLEAMATGLPVILSDNTGLSELCNEEYNYPVPTHKLSPALRFPKDWGFVGNWYEPKFDVFKSHMQYVFEHQDEARNKGLNASDWVHNTFTFEHTAKRLLEILNQYFN